MFEFKGERTVSTDRIYRWLRALSTALPLNGGGGVVHGYGLAASQLQRIKEKGLTLTIAVDKVAASGGYMMACVADKLLASQFAYIGSIGVLAQLPNFNKLLKKLKVKQKVLNIFKIIKIFIFLL